jgi:hypothetical protein
MQPPGYPPPPPNGPPPGYGMPQQQPMQQPAYGRPPYPSQPGQMPPPQKKSNVGLIVGLAIGGLVVVGVLGGAIAYFVAHAGHGSLPLDAAKLPPQTHEIDTMLIDATREKDKNVKEIYLASEMSSAFCAGRHDPAERLENIGRWGSSDAKKFFDPKNLDDVRSELQCGAAFASSLADKHASFLSFDADDEKPESRHRVKIGHFKMKTLPTTEGYTSISFGTIAGFCQTTIPTYGASSFSSLLTPPPAGSAAAPAPTTKSCDDKSNAAFAVGDTWFFGDKASLDQLSKTILVPKKTLPTRVAAIQDAENATSNLPQAVLIAEPKTSKDVLEYPCDWAASQLGVHYSSGSSAGSGSGSGSGSSGSSGSSGDIKSRADFLAACFPAKQDSKLIEEIDAKLRAIAFETDPDYVTAGAITGNIILVTRDPESAEAAERSVKELVGDWKSSLELNAPKLIKAGKDQASTASQKKFADVADTYFQALSKLTVSRSGRVLKLSYKAKFTKEDESALQGDDKADEKRVAVAAVLSAIRDKKAIPQASLAKLVGSSWATYLLLPPLPPKPPSPKTKLTLAECKSVKSKLQSISISDLPSGDATKAYLDQKYAMCDWKLPEVTEDQQKCLATFSTASEYAACMGGDSVDPRQPPESEFGDKKKK